jgi:nucleoside phosphorylase
MRRGLLFSFALCIAVLASAVPAAIPAAAGPACTPRLLVLSAFPAEMDALLPAAQVRQTVVVQHRAFYVGRLEGNDVVMGLTGIGLVNATQTTTVALRHFRCGPAPEITGVVFSGVSGGRTYIGDVTAPSRWTIDNGKTWIHVDPAMLATARAVAGSVHLDRTTPIGDPACAGLNPDLMRTISVQRQPRVIVGGGGDSADPFGGRRFPCFPFGGDVFGCEPCLAPSHQLPDVERFAKGAAPFLDPYFFIDYFRNSSPSASASKYTADDMETAAVAKVASANGVPFIAFRALSDGKGDPLMLPGFPFQFFVYKDLAAGNAAKMALAFLRAWATPIWSR